MSIKTCLQCENRYTKGVSGFDIFPREDYRWCSYRCMFLWLLVHDVTANGEYILSIWHRVGKQKRTLELADCLTTEDLIKHVPEEILIKVRNSFKKDL